MTPLDSPHADVWVHEGWTLEQALERTTHMAIGAHQDDIEFMAMHGILECFARRDRWFTGITITDGGGSPRSGAYEKFSDVAMRKLRIAEQRRAATMGEYACQIQLGLTSALAKDADDDSVVQNLSAILEQATPEVVYIHNPTDRHDTHVACCLRAIDALRMLPSDDRPEVVLGCEVWRGLDWLPDDLKRVLQLNDPGNLIADLCAVFDSQIAGGKRYDLALKGRHLANATFGASHEVDCATRVSIAMDLTPLIEDPALDVAEFTLGCVDALKDDISDRIARMDGDSE